MALELRGVSRAVGGRVHIHPIDLTLQSGTISVLLGPSLSGKVRLDRQSGDAVKFRCTLGATKITGSEAVVHLTHGADRWGGLVHGVHGLGQFEDLPDDERADRRRRRRRPGRRRSVTGPGGAHQVLPDSRFLGKKSGRNFA